MLRSQAAIRNLQSAMLALALALAIGLAPLPQLLAAVGLALGAALPFASPVFGVYLAVLSVPLQDLVALPGGLSATQAAVLLMGAGWGLRLGARSWGRGPRRAPLSGTVSSRPDPLAPRPPSLAPWLLLLWALLLSASLTPFSRSEALKETARWGVAFLVWLVAATSLRTRWHVYGLLACLLLAPAATALVGLAQFATGDGPPTFRIAPDLPFVRAYGTIGQPNSFAGYINMAWPIALGAAGAATYALLRRPGGLRPAGEGIREEAAPPHTSPVIGSLLMLGSWLIVLVLLAALAASFSRGGWLGAAAGAIGMAAALLGCWTADRGRRATDRRPRTNTRTLLVPGRWSLVILVGIAAVIGLARVLPQPVAARLASITRSVGFFDAGAVQVTPENFAAVERMAQVQAGWRMFRARPLVGVGPGNYSVVYPRVAVTPWYISRGHAHNFYLHIAAEAGALGLAAYLALIGTLAARAVALARHADGLLTRTVAVGCCGMIAAVAGHNLFENLHVLHMSIQMAAAWALLTCAGAWRPQAPGEKIQVHFWRY